MPTSNRLSSRTPVPEVAVVRRPRPEATWNRRPQHRFWEGWGVRWGGLLLWLAGALWGSAQTSQVEVIADLLALFPHARVQDAQVCEVQRPTRSGGVAQDALFQHPQSPQRPARVEYTIELPRIQRGERLLLAWATGLADGARFDHGEDGVRFVVELGGQPVFTRPTRECRWQNAAVDLTPFANRRLNLALVIDALNSSDHDWAAWGSPRILWLRGDPVPPSTRSVGDAYGVLAVKKNTAATVTATMTSPPTNLLTSWSFPASITTTEANTEWLTQDYAFPNISETWVTWQDWDQIDEAWHCRYPARPRISLVAPAQAITVPQAWQSIHVGVKNEGLGRLPPGTAHVELTVADQALGAKPVPELQPGEVKAIEWTWQAPKKSGRYPVQARLVFPASQAPEGLAQEHIAAIEVMKNLPSTPPFSPNLTTLSNRWIKMEFVRADEGYAYARVWGNQAGTWILAGVWRPLLRLILSTPTGDHDWEIRPRSFQVGRSTDNSQPVASLNYRDVIRDVQGTAWAVMLSIELNPLLPVAHLHYEWQPSAERQVKALWGPNLYAGEGLSGAAKTWGLFPGLEYLYGPEPSSNPRDLSAPWHDRRTPDPLKITLPLMAVSIAADSPSSPANPDRFFCPDSTRDRPALPAAATETITLGLCWDPLQSWDGTHQFPSARFSSPNSDEGMRNHRLGLFLPSVPDWIAENADRAARPYTVAAGQILKLDASMLVVPGPVLAALRLWYQLVGGLPTPSAWPRSFDDELTLCRQAFLETLWDADGKKWRHAQGWPSSHTPGFASLLWYDAHLAQHPATRESSRARMEQSAQAMLAEAGPGLLVSTANCHILRWEFPFLYGYLPEAMLALDTHILGLIQQQNPEGGWTYLTTNAPQRELGRTGDSVLGTNARHAADLLRYARITGDPKAETAGMKALHFMEQFRVPRGAQMWECPMYQPDLLAAAWAVAAYLDGLRISGDLRWLQDAVYWAETGLPFIYHWRIPDHPMMLGATVPVFGSTFYRQSWLGTPVQWCGLVYGFQVGQLAAEMELAQHTGGVSPLPASLNLPPAEWRKVSELILVSALRQQWDQGEVRGTFPDSLSHLQQRSPPFLNPEDILVNVLAQKGYSPDIQTTRVATPSRILVISSGAKVRDAAFHGSTLTFQIQTWAGDPCPILVYGLQPQQITAAGRPLPFTPTPVQRAEGWSVDVKTGRLFLVVLPNETLTRVEIQEGL